MKCSLLLSTNMEKIGIYGGSFDPPHKGHLLLAENLREKCGADKVLIIPAASSPFKNGTSASDEDRIKMCQLTFTQSYFEVSNLEIKRGGKSYTVDTLKQIKEIYPDSELYLFMGEDMLLSFHKWYKYEEILTLCKVAAACRLRNENSFLKMKKAVDTIHINSKENILIFGCKPIEISSTEIRESLKLGENLNITDDVLRFIKSKGLYK